MIDLKLIETGDGGDLVLQGNDLLIDLNFESMIYLALFGGDEFWGNDLLLDGSQKYGSKTEKILQNVALNSVGRLKIENAVKEDLNFFLKDIPETILKVFVTIVSDDKLSIEIILNNEAYTLSFTMPGQLIFDKNNA